MKKLLTNVHVFFLLFFLAITIIIKIYHLLTCTYIAIYVTVHTALPPYDMSLIELCHWETDELKVIPFTLYYTMYYTILYYTLLYYNKVQFMWSVQSVLA